jgi:DNA-binding transcriptional ArsR family regulator
MSLLAFDFRGRPDELDVDGRWFDDVASAVGPEVVATLEDADVPLSPLWSALVPIATAVERDASAASLVDAVHSLRAGRLRALLTASGDPDEEITRLLDHGLGRVLGRARSVVRVWVDAVWRPVAAETAAVLDAAADAARARAGELDTTQLVASVTNGVRYDGSGYERFVLLPTVAMRPWNVMSDDGTTAYVCFPVPAEILARPRDEPPEQLLKLGRAIGDDRRLRILRRLATGDASLAQLADHVDLGKSTVHHHLVQLRAAGLVWVRPGADREYSLRPEAIDAIAPLLADYLGLGR